MSKSNVEEKDDYGKRAHLSVLDVLHSENIKGANSTFSSNLKEDGISWGPKRVVYKVSLLPGVCVLMVKVVELLSEIERTWDLGIAQICREEQE